MEGVSVIGINFVDTSPLNSHGAVNDHIQFVYTWMFWASVVVGVLVSVAILYSFFRFRRKTDDEQPRQVHGNTRLEIAWTIVPFLILVSLFGITAANMGFISDPPSDRPHLSVKIQAQRFAWTMFYTGKKQRTSHREVSSVTPQDVKREANLPQDKPNGLLVPADTPVDIQLTSTDVIHSFYIPALAGQENAVPGQTNHFWLEARPGKYYGQCTELCGDGHAGMVLEIDALPKDKFQQWLYQQEAT
ncbi:MAG TPA: cytochrome c oxidase subunit II [Candidatus Sulfotelmatobacter sp.]|nr:cytochrome c oxidase subunit II [Candidatus Sulfotelmatobacter sp.]